MRLTFTTPESENGLPTARVANLRIFATERVAVAIRLVADSKPRESRAARHDRMPIAPVTAAAVRSLPLQAVPSHLPVPGLELVMIWLKRRDRDPEVAWLRGALHRSASALSPDNTSA